MKAEVGRQKLIFGLQSSDFRLISQNKYKIILVTAFNVLHLPLDIAGWSSGSPEKSQISHLLIFHGCSKI
jgi:hypothetical protein